MLTDQRPRMMWGSVLLALTLVPSVGVMAGCERPTLIDDLLEPPGDGDGDGDGPGDGDGDGPGDGDGDGDAGPSAVDVLLVVDNSASMCEEQALLVESFFDSDCPITNLLDIPAEYRDADDATLDQLSADCGFIQLMAAAGLDARVGVVSTDVGPCDDRFDYADDPAFANAPNAVHCGMQPGDWGRRPQRGCLIGPPGDNNRFIGMGDDDAFEHFVEIIGALGVYGSAFERGFDQVVAFLDEDVADGCPNTASDFLRPGADLVIAFMSDEDDCSHRIGAQFPDENAGETCDRDTEEIPALRDPPIDPLWCYQRPEQLRPVSDMVDALTAWATAENKAVRVAAIAGGVYEEGRDEIVSVGCVVDDNGKPDDTCVESFGNSNATGPGLPCNPEALAAAGQPPCCSADPGTRYQALANAFGSGLNDSICYRDYREPLLDGARRAAGR
jgi:hypothetical protein